MIKLIREHLSTKIFIITVCLLITVGSAIYGMVALGMSRSYFLELDRSLSNQTEKMVLQLSNTSVQEIDGILKMFALEHGISIVLKDSDEKVLGIYGDMEYSLAPGTDVEDILLGSGITESYSCKLNILDSSVWKQGESKYWTGIIKKNFTYVGGYYFFGSISYCCFIHKIYYAFNFKGE